MAKIRMPRYVRAQPDYRPVVYLDAETVGEAVASLVVNSYVAWPTLPPSSVMDQQHARIERLVNGYFADADTKVRTAKVVAHGRGRHAWLILGTGKPIRLPDLICALPVMITASRITSPAFGDIW